jgi:hypothetical protein
LRCRPCLRSAKQGSAGVVAAGLVVSLIAHH